MNHSCDSNASETQGRTRRRWAREGLRWLVAGIVLVVMPKCPACLAAYLAAATGLGLSLTATTWFRWSLLSISAGALIHLVLRRLGRPGAVIITYFNRETSTCNTRLPPVARSG